MEEQTKKKAGRPKENAYQKYVEGKENDILAICEKGADNKIIAEFLGCGLTTVCNLKRDYPEFKKLLKRGGDIADDKVVSALYKRALGYDAEETCTEVKVSPDGSAQTTYVKKTKKHIPPDTTAAIFWLKNRRREEWNDKQDIGIETDAPINISIIKDDGSASKA